MSNFSRDTKVQLYRATTLAGGLVVLLEDNGFVDAPMEVRKNLPIDNHEKVTDFLDGVIPALKEKLLDKANSAAGMSSGETICLATACALEGFLHGVFVAPTQDPGDAEIDKMFPPEVVTDRIRLIELD
jgi:hypothetical protein